MRDECPLLGAKRTWPDPSPMSANDPKRTLAATPRLGVSGCRTIQRVQLNLFHFSALRRVSAQVYRKI